MSLRPGMSDGRSFGDSLYLPNCQINETFKSQVNVSSEQEYREYLQKNSTAIKSKVNTPIPIGSLIKK